MKKLPEEDGEKSCLINLDSFYRFVVEEKGSEDKERKKEEERRKKRNGKL